MNKMYSVYKMECFSNSHTTFLALHSLSILLNQIGNNYQDKHGLPMKTY